MDSSGGQSERDSGSQRGLRLHADDNVAIVMGHVTQGSLEIIGGDVGTSVDVVEPIDAGHKVALCPIAEGAAVVKYGVTIGLATAPIATGAWVHTHNCRSRLDERSHTLDRHTGAPTDTYYV